MNPLELLQHRHAEMETEYVRVYTLACSTKQGQKFYEQFEYRKKKDLRCISKLLAEYKETIQLLTELNGLKHEG